MVASPYPRRQDGIAAVRTRRGFRGKAVLQVSWNLTRTKPVPPPHEWLEVPAGRSQFKDVNFDDPAELREVILYLEKANARHSDSNQ